MAPALSSNSFYVSTGIHAKPDQRAVRPRVTVSARTNPFGVRKPKSEGESQDEGSSKANGFFIDFGKLPDTMSLKFPDAKSLVPVLSNQSASFFSAQRRKEENTVFVAGATGQSGARIAQMLLRQGFAVRAGVLELSSAQELARLAATYKIISPAESKRLNAVESTFEDPESIAKAIGPSTKLVVTIGAAENGPAAAVTTNDALQVIRAAELAGVGHVAVVYDSSGSSPSFTSSYNVIDGFTSFFSNFSSLFAKQPLSIADFLSKVAETEVSYTLIKASLTDDYAAESSYGVVVSKEGTVSESKVATSQIAKLVADVFSNTTVAENKVVEVSTSPSASSKSIAELFSAIPEDGRRKAYAEAVAKAKAQEEAMLASEQAREAAESAKKLKKGVKKQSEQEAEADSLTEEAQAKARSAGITLDNLLTKAKDFGGGDFSWDKLSSRIATAIPQKPDEKPGAQVATVRGQAKARSLPPQKAIVKRPAFRLKLKQSEPKLKEKQPEQKAEVRNVFGGLFKQETIYVDDE